jgi:hypothetical protein
MLAWEGEGAWVLDPLEGQDWDRYNELPVTTDVSVFLFFSFLFFFAAEIPLIYGFPLFDFLTFLSLMSTARTLNRSVQLGMRMLGIIPWLLRR